MREKFNHLYLDSHERKLLIRKNLRRKSTEKIDAAVATVMALDRAIRNQGSEGSVYDGRGILVF